MHIQITCLIVPVACNSMAPIKYVSVPICDYGECCISHCAQILWFVLYTSSREDISHIYRHSRKVLVNPKSFVFQIEMFRGSHSFPHSRFIQKISSERFLYREQSYHTLHVLGTTVLGRLSGIILEEPVDNCCAGPPQTLRKQAIVLFIPDCSKDLL